MDTLIQSAPRDADGRAPWAAASRIYYFHPLLAGPATGWGAHLDRIARLGFNHVLSAPLWAAGPTGDLFLTGDFARADARIAEGGAQETIRRFAAACAERDLALSLDVVLDRVAAGNPAVSRHPDAFVPPDAAAACDPRRAFLPPGVAAPRLGERAGQTWFADLLAGLAEAGVAGVRLIGLASVAPDVASALVTALRAGAPDMHLMAWTPGLPAAARALLPRMDAVFSSLPWWDFRAGWFWREAAALAPLGCVIAPAEAPFGERHGRDPRAALRTAEFAAFAAGGWLMPMGYEYGAVRPLDPANDTPADWQALASAPRHDHAAAIATLNGALRGQAALAAGTTVPIPGAGAAAGMVMAGSDPRRAEAARIVIANAGLDRAVTLDATPLFAADGARFDRIEPILPPDAAPVRPGDRLTLAPGAVVVLQAERAPAPKMSAPDLTASAAIATRTPRIAIEAVTPAVDGGAFPVKRIVGERVVVEADMIFDGHDIYRAALLWRPAGDADWREVAMRPLGNDRWRADFPLGTIGPHLFTVEAWRDTFGTWRNEVAKKHAAGVDTRVELLEGVALLTEAAAHAGGTLDALLAQVRAADTDGQRALLLADTTAALMDRADPRHFRVRHDPPLQVLADRPGAAFASWYEIFPRSMSDDPDRHGTFDDVIRHLPRVRAMGFDVLYFPPIHPIGRTNRKGRNNSLKAGPDDPGSPYAIGADAGGHDAVLPELGTLADFRRMVEAAAGHGLEIAIDFAIQCSPDHPWLKAHHDWFAWRPDGSMKYAENPPKKYEDIVNVDFYAEGSKPALWVALAEVVLFWCEQGVRLFRVDNPHTKPLPFWQWMIEVVRARHPDAIFLAEAFTRPKVMYRLAKVGFGQSYTYFTWRNTKAELIEYLTELADGPPRDFFRPHFFVNTPDINPVFLQNSGRPGFLIRAALAATLSGLWGVYCGFELCEATPVPNKEEYLDSEKYQIRAWDWDRPGNIVPEIVALNRLRRENPALQTHLDIAFHVARNEAVLWYRKGDAARGDVVLVAVSLDPFNAQSAECELPLWEWGLPDDAALEMDDLLADTTSIWRGKQHVITLTPDRPYAIWRARPAA
jgi:starch synthase (maltosyl-transferring)